MVETLNLNCSDVVETVTFETETSLKRRDRDFIKNSETSKFVEFAQIFEKNVVTTSKLNLFRISGSFPTCFGFLTCKYNREETR